jgi:hypothetical protein
MNLIGLVLILKNDSILFKRGIEDSIECSETNTMNLPTHHNYVAPYSQTTTSPSSSSSASSSSSNSCLLSNGSTSSPYSPNIQYLTATSMAPNGNPIIFALNPSAPISQTQIQQHDLSTSMNNRPEAKKVKIQKSQPSKVVHIRNIPPQISEIEVIQFGLIFGNITTVLNLRSKCQVR